MSDNYGEHIDVKIRANLAYIWSIAAIAMLGYILVEWGGSHTEILTLIIGLIGGTIVGGIFGFYFGGTTIKKADSQVPVTGANPQINVNPTTPNTDSDSE